MFNQHVSIKLIANFYNFRAEKFKQRQKKCLFD